MPRAPRTISANECYHVFNRGNQKARLFHDAADYNAFLGYIREAQQRLELPLLAICLMPNHVHFVARPRGNRDIAAWISWLFTTHVRRHHRKYGTTGRLWQGRYKTTHVQQDHHLLTVLRYVERNALTAKLVAKAEDWCWGSLGWRHFLQPPVDLTPSPVDLPRWWREFVNQPMTAAELQAVRECVYRQRPFGSPEWVESTAEETGVKQSLAPIGRPKRKR
jgi:putative transposase